MKRFALRGARVCTRVAAAMAVCAVCNTAPVFTQHAEAARTFWIAKRYVGLHERQDTKKIIKTVGVNPRSTPWCGAFIAAVHKRAGKDVPSGYLRAASWKRGGKKVSLKKARKGDVVVIRTRRGNHVGFYAGKKDGRVLLLGGNQSNQVKISAYGMKAVQSVRRF